MMGKAIDFRRRRYIRRMLVTPRDRMPLTRSVTIVSVSGALAQSFINGR